MYKIGILVASVRTGRKSDRVALFFQKFIESNYEATVELIDLNDYNFPVFNERLKFMANPAPEVLAFADRVRNCDGILIVTPEYNGGYPASLKNVVDLLTDEWKRKPVAISTVSAGPFAGAQVITSLQFSLWKIKALVATAMFAVATVEKAYETDGTPVNKEASEKNAKPFVDELVWCMQAVKRMKE